MEHHRNASNYHVPSYQANQIPRPIIPAPHHHFTNPPHQTQLDHQVRQFWTNQTQEALLVKDFKTPLPLARVKKIMKFNDEVKMISSEAPILLAKACEMFIMDLTLRSWSHTEGNKRRVIQKRDVITALENTELFDFLADTVHNDEFIEEDVESKPQGGDFMQFQTERASNYYMPPPSPTPPHVGNPVVHVHQDYIARPMCPQSAPPPPPPYVAGSYRQG